MQISNNKLNKILIWPTIFFSFIIFISLIIYIYFNAYRIIIQADEVISLKLSIPEESIDIKKFNQIVERIESKAIKQETSEINNLFK